MACEAVERTDRGAQARGHHPRAHREVFVVLGAAPGPMGSTWHPPCRSWHPPRRSWHPPWWSRHPRQGRLRRWRADALGRSSWRVGGAEWMFG
jgi:hypothetical protein